uniref:Uncharacterized protein n=1 Tax=Oryza sativa subsp. japonica TaxID=39947 RepID=Q75G76_ORYSJ|nr:hypothetical protein OSJNBa0008D12.18 [Oryza sativa Japonica Group]
MHGTAGYGQDGAQVARQRPREVPRSSNDPPPVTAAQDGAKVCGPALHAMVEVRLQDAMAIGENFGQIDEGVSIYDTPMVEAQSVAGCGHAASGVARTAAVEPRRADDRDGGAKSGGRQRVDG